MVNLVILYAQHSQDQAFHNELRTLLRPWQSLFNVWSRADMTAGAEWRSAMQQQIANADWVILLISSNYLADTDKVREWEQLARENGKKLIPILVRPALWEHDPHLANLHMLPVHPSDGQIRATTLWSNRDEVMNQITRKLVDLADTQKNTIKDLSMEEYKNTREVPISQRPQTQTTMSNSEFYENGYALLIGVGADLPATINDAQALYNLLTDKRKAAFNPDNVFLLTGEKATKQGILDAFSELKTKVANNNKATVIISYSGHGTVVNENGNPVYFLQPHGFKWYYKSETQLLGTDFTQAVNEIAAKKKLVILDCCHAGGVRDEQGTPNHTQLKRELERGRGTVVIAACEDDEKALDLERLGKGEYGLFTQVLLESLSTEPARTNNNGYVKLSDIIEYFDTKFEDRLKEVQPNHKQNPILDLTQYSLADSFIVCAYDIVKARGGGDIPPPPPTNNQKTENMDKLRQFKATLRQQLDERGFAAAPNVLNQLESSPYFYTKSTLADLRGRISERSTQENPANFLVGLEAFIDSLRNNL